MTRKDIVLLGVLFALIGFSITCTVLPAIAGTADPTVASKE